MTDIVAPKGKNFWDKPEGLWGMAIVTVLGAGVIWFLTWFVPMMVKLGLGILGMAIIWGTIAAIGITVFTDNPLRQAISLKIQVISRNLRRAVIDEDPIAILRLLQVKARKRMDELDNLMPGVKAALRKVMSSAQVFADKMEKHKAEAAVHRNNGDREEEARALAKYGKADNYHTDMVNFANDVQKMDAMLTKGKKVVSRIIEDTEDEINNEEIHLNATQEVSGAWRKFRSIFKASGGEADLRAEALRSSADQQAARLGEIDQFMGEFQDVLNNVGTQDAINAEMARQKINHLSSYNLETKSLSNSPSATLKTSINKVTPIRAGIPASKQASLGQRLPK